MSTKSTPSMNSTEIAAIAASKGLSEEELVRMAKSTLGRMAGRSGKGDSKRRPKSHYKKMVAARNLQRLAAKAAKAATV